MAYTYDPVLISEDGLHKMRFELGDTLVSGGADTCALSDEEYIAVIGRFPWIKAKLRLLEAICMKMAFQVDTKIDVLAYDFSDRARMWQGMYQDLKKQLAVGAPSANRSALGDSYFYLGMHNSQYR